jgi:DNA polymerase elongation subunit (family B)
VRILLLDIETAPHLATVWGLWQQNVAINQIIETGYTLCWAAKWHDEREVMFDSIKASSPKRMIGRVHKLLAEADAVVHYNGTKFDIPTLNKEFLLHGLNPPAPYKQIDLLQTARRRFRLASNKLDFVAQQLGLGKKLAHKGHELWLGCMNKDAESWRVMEAYNKQDVLLLEKVYDRLLPWVQNHPNRNNYGEHHVCPKCGGEKHQRRGYAVTSTRRYARMQCLGCGTWFRSTDCEPGRANYVEAAA